MWRVAGGWQISPGWMTSPERMLMIPGNSRAMCRSVLGVPGKLTNLEGMLGVLRVPGGQKTNSEGMLGLADEG